MNKNAIKMENFEVGGNNYIKKGLKTGEFSAILGH